MIQTMPAPAADEVESLRREVADLNRIRKAASRDNIALLDPIRHEPEIAMVQDVLTRGEYVENPLATAVGALIERLQREAQSVLASTQLSPDMAAELNRAAEATYEAAEGGSNDDEISALQAFRDFALSLLSPLAPQENNHV